MDDIRSVRCPRCGASAHGECVMDGTEQQCFSPTANLVGAFKVEFPTGTVHLERVGAYLESDPHHLGQRTQELLDLMGKVTGG